MLEQGKNVRSPPPEEEGAAERTSDELTTIPIPCPPALLGGRRERIQERSQDWEEGRGGGKAF